MDNTQSTELCWHLLISRGMRLCDPDRKSTGCAWDVGAQPAQDWEHHGILDQIVSIDVSPEFVSLQVLIFFFSPVYVYMNLQIYLRCPL